MEGGDPGRERGNKGRVTGRKEVKTGQAADTLALLVQSF